MCPTTMCHTVDVAVTVNGGSGALARKPAFVCLLASALLACGVVHLQESLPSEGFYVPLYYKAIAPVFVFSGCAIGTSVIYIFC